MGLNTALRELYLVDQQVRGLESRLDGARKNVRAQQIRMDQLNQQVNELSDQLKQSQAKAGTMENEVNTIDARVTKLRDQMNAVKTNKEYSAMLVEVNTLKADKSQLEEKAFEIMTQVEAQQKQLADLNARCADQTKIKALADKQLAERMGEVGEQLAAIQAQRVQAASHVPPDMLAIFDRLADNYDGEAMAAIIEEDRRRLEYTCGGCYMQIPIERVNLLITQDQLVRCSSCQRILYIEPQLKEAMTGSK
ncbi:MAG: C4-type zinc ribbon domain-containing protein [Phycisphaeraceae bacterium]